MKGEVELDVALEAARQAWGARELLMRLGFGNDQLTITTGRIAEASGLLVLHAVVQILDPTKPVSSAFYIDCGAIPTTALFGHAVQRFFDRVGSGTVAEATLRREFEATNAWIGREEIVARIQSHGYPVKLSSLDEQGPN